MEYRCLIAGDVVAEPRMLLQRLLGQPLTEDDRRHLRHRSLRDVLLCRATHTFPVTQTHAQESTVSGAEKVIGSNSTGALTVSTGQNNTVQGSSTRTMGPFTLTMPNPSMPSVDITILLDLVESPEELEAILRPELPAHGPLAALARAHLTKRQRFHAAHAILLAFNPFSHDSVDRARFAWTAVLRRCRGTVSASGLSREFSLQTQQSSHDALLYTNDDSNGHAGRTAMASSRERYHGNMSALSLYSPSLPVVTSPTNAMSWAMPMHSNSNNNNNNMHLMDSAAMSGDVVAFGEPNSNVSGPTVLLVGTRFDLLSQAIGATPTVMPPAASTLAELAAGLSACLYFEVADTWPERLAELRTRLAQACVGELQERVLRVRAEDVMRVRQASMQRAFHELHLSEQDHTTIATGGTTTNNTNTSAKQDGSEALAVAQEEHRAEEEELAVSFAWSAQLSFAAPSPTSMTAAAAAMTGGGNTLKATGPEATAIAAREAAVAAGAQSSPSPRTAAAAVLQSETSVAYTTDTTAGRSVWTWRRHPRTGRVYFVHRPTRHTQYTRPPDYDGREPTMVSTVASNIISNDADNGKATSCEMKSQGAKSKTSKAKELQLNKVTESFVAQRAPSEALAKAASSTAPSSPATTVLSIIASTPPTAVANGATAQVVRTLLLSSPKAQRMSPLQMDQGEEGDKSVASPQRALCAAELRARLALLQELERMCDAEWDRAMNKLQRDVDTLRNRSTVEGNEPKETAGSVGGTSKDTLHATVRTSSNPSLSARDGNTDVTQCHKDHDTRVLYDAAQLAREESALCAEEQAAHEALRAARWKYEVWSDRLDTQCLVGPYTSTTHQSHYDPTISKETVTTTAGEASGRDALVRVLCDGVTTLYNLQQLHDTLQRTQTSISVAEDAVPTECVQHLLHEMQEAMEHNVQDTAALVVPEALSEPWQRWLIQALQVAAIELATQQQQQQKSQCATRTSESALSSTTSPSLDVSRYGGVIALDALQARRVVQEQKMSLWCALRAAVLERSEHKKEKSSASDGFYAAFAQHVALLEAAVDSGVVST